MTRLALVGGHSIMETGIGAGAERREVDTPWGPVAVLDAGRWVVLQRHGLDRHVAPHGIDHRANLQALTELGCDRVVALGSVGGLKEEIGVGTFLAPDDFIALQLGISYSDDAEGHRIAGFDAEWRRAVLDVWSEEADMPLRDGGVYWQTIGPRLETQAEIRLIAAHADVVGMTLASECVLAGELGLAYAAVCVVDNLANGVGERPLTMQELRTGLVENRKRVVSALGTLLPALAG